MDWLLRLSSFDQKLFLALSQQSEKFALQRPARYVSRSGDGYFQVILPLLLFATLPADIALRFLAVVAAAFIVERACYKLLKSSLKRRRPPQFFPSFQSVVEASDEFSFPSGHTCAAFLLWTLCSAMMPALAIPLLIWAVLVGCSRVILGVHFPADIAAGAALGFGIGQLFVPLL